MEYLPGVVPSTGLHYYNNPSQGNGAFNQSVNGKEDYFSEAILNLNASGTGTMHSDDSRSGVWDYYNTGNSLTSPFIDWLPAQSSPSNDVQMYSQTVLSNDGLDRPIAQSAPGEVFTFQGGEERGTRTYYGTPTQKELDRLFGNEVGHSEFYQKKLTIDANKQVSVEYLNNKDQVIATSLAGSIPSNLLALNSYLPFTSSDVLIRVPGIPDIDFELVESETVLISEPLQVDFVYSLSPWIYNLPCVPANGNNGLSALSDVLVFK